MIVSSRSLTIALAAFALQACLFEGSSGGGDKDPDINPNGTRPFKAPTVSYTTNDSLIDVRIKGSRIGEESCFWIYRNDTLLSIPDYAGGFPEGNHTYRLIDSIKTPGSYKYYVRYGTNADSLGEKSKDFVYAWAGHSRSGRIMLALQDPSNPFPIVGLSTPTDETPVGARFERKLGSEGSVAAVDTLEGPPAAGNYQIQDTGFVAADTMIYYRASILDGITETWMPPTPWDSIKVKNKVWTYAPTADLVNLGTEIRVTVSNYPFGPVMPEFFLCRNSSASKSGRVLVDSISLDHGFSSATILSDIPDTAGTYFYWVEAVDRWGRTSVRSTPKEVKFTGRPVGPKISSISLGSNNIQIQFIADQGSATYILQRAQDTAKEISSVDTVSGGFGSGLVYDSPRASGYYWYRILAYPFDPATKDPGPWARSPFFTYAPVYYPLSATFVNRGTRVEVTSETMYNAYSVLYRSKFSTGKDSVAVDTLLATENPNRLIDIPEVGAWYYRVERYSTNPDGANVIYRSEITRIDFTGKIPGPSISSLTVYAPYIVVAIQGDLEALAYILERSKDGEKDWAICDTLPAPQFGGPVMNDRPPEDGFWYYRVRALMPGLKASDPGQVMRTPKAFTYGLTYSNTLIPEVANTGARIEVTLYSSVSASKTYLMRGTTPDYKNGAKADSSVSSGGNFQFRDAPPIGKWYYWVEQIPRAPSEFSAYRSATPAEVEFTGSPGITSLAKVSSGIRITYPRTALEDTLEIWRSTGTPTDTASFSLALSLPAGDFSDYAVDETVSKTAAAAYSYRLRIRRAGTLTALGPVKSIYYEP